ncbi:MAG: hypothetical protein ACPGES_13330 [Coraliomargarita sp.]
MKLKQRIHIFLSAIILFGALTGCSSTKTENGATIEKSSRIPFL